MLPVVSLFVLVVFMGVILADSADAKKFVGSLDQANSGTGEELAGRGSKSIARSFTTGVSSFGYVIHSVGVQVHTASNSRRADVGIYADNNGAPGNNVYDLSGDVSSIGVRYFTAPHGSTLERNTTYWVVVKVGSGSGSFRLQGTSNTGEDTSVTPRVPSIGWSLASQSRYTANNYQAAFYDGGIKIGIFGTDKSINWPARGKPSISSAAPGGVVQAGYELTASIDGISDRNGIINDTLSYQWILVDSTAGTETDISRATTSSTTSSTYTPLNHNAGRRLKVRVSFIDADTYRETVVSDASRVIRASDGDAPPEGKPVIVGTLGYQQVLTADTSSIHDDNGLGDGFSYQWHSTDGPNGYRRDIINGATGSNYTISYDDLGKGFSVDFSYSDNSSNYHGLNSDSTGLVPFPDLVEGSSTRLVSNMEQYDNDSRIVSEGSSGIDQKFTTGDSFDYVIEKVVLKVTASSSGSPDVRIYDEFKTYDPVLTLDGNVDSTGKKDFTAPANSILSGNAVYSVYVGAGTVATSYRLQSTLSNAEDSGADSGWSIADAQYVFGEGLFKFEIHGRSRHFPDINVSFDKAEYDALEGGFPTEVVVRLDRDPQRVVTVPIVALRSGGVLVDDYSLSADSLTFRPDETEKSFNVTANIDSDSSHESIVLSFGSLPKGIMPGDNATLRLLDANASNRPASGVVSVSGRAAVGYTLSANLSDVSDSDGLENIGNYSYQWVRVVNDVESNISGAVNSWYNVVADDVGKSLAVRVGFLDDLNNNESVDSDDLSVDVPPVPTTDVILVLSNWSLVPMDLRSVGSEFRLFFVTSAERNGWSTDIDEYNAFVMGAAQLGHEDIRPYAGHFRALASTSGVSAISNTDTGYNSSSLGVPIYWLDHQGSAAHDYREFYDGSRWRKQSGQNEFGEAVFFTSADFIWTGTTPSGASDVSPLGSSTPVVGRPGHSSPYPIGSQTNEPKDHLFPLYGMSLVFKVANTTNSTLLPPLQVNNPPVIRSFAYRLWENQNFINTVLASDSDVQDSIVGYSVSGGVDSALFSITNSGRLTTNFVPDFERPLDNDGDNVYDIVVTVTSGVGDRVRTANSSIKLTTADVAEAPSAPSAPSLSSPSSTSLLVGWSAPSNKGPAISDYDVGYSRNSNGLFTDWSHSGNSTTATITGLNASTLYYVRVLARNAEGSSDWSPTANFTTTKWPTISSITSDHDNNTYSPFCIGSCIISPDQDPQPSTWDGVIKIKVVFNQIVTVTGSPILNLTNTGNANDVATYDSGSGTDTLVFHYDIPSGRGGSNINVSVLNLNGGTIGNSNGTASLDVPNGLNLADNKKINIDSRPPRITAYITEAEHFSQSNSIGEAIDGTGETKWYGNKRYMFVDYNSHYRHGTWVIHRIDDDNVTSCNASTLASASNMGGPNINNRYIPLYTTERNGKKFCGSVADSYGNRDFSLVYIRGIDRDNPEITVSNLTLSSLVSATAQDTNCGDRTDGHYSRCSGINEDKFYALPIDSGTACGGAAYDAAPGVIDDYHYTAGTMLTVAGGKKICFRVHDNLKGDGRTDYAESAVGFVINSLPVFSSDSSFSVQENSLNVGTVTASDGDVQDSVVGYRVSGGVDSALFEITGGGVLTFRSAPNYESPQDGGTDNVYLLEVEAVSGVGGRVHTATQSITVTVNDVAEAPSAPSAPTLSSPSSTSLRVTWSLPGNTGPSIIDYDVGYGQNSSGPFTDWPHSDASRSTTITGLNASTLYYVRVLARNAEGSSGWSPTASFTTGSVSSPPVTNNPPVFTSSSSFSVNENTFYVGTVVADDADGADSVTGYRVSGGADSARFSITDGVLTFRNPPDYENPVDSGGNNVYNLIVTVTSGTGGRVLTAIQSIVVTVVDVSEAPSASVTNSPPVFTSSSTFSVNENVRSVGTVVASDSDGQDSVTDYRISSGVDSAFFSITNSGVLTFRSAPNFESPVDSGGNNVYNLVVTVTSGTGSRVRTATQTITITVDDVAEGDPMKPSEEVVLVYGCG